MRSERLHEKVVAELVWQIVGGKLPAGSLLRSEPELSQWYGVSRIVIREAARVLSSIGLISVAHGRGAMVNPEEEWDPLDPLILDTRVKSGGAVEFMRQLLEVRMTFEIGAAGLAAERATATDLDAMHQALQEMAANLDDPTRASAADGRFHASVQRAAGNPILRRVMSPVHRVMQDVFILDVREVVPDGYRSAYDHHLRIFARIAARDPAGAREAMRMHLEESGKHLEMMLSQRAARRQETAGR